MHRYLLFGLLIYCQITIAQTGLLPVCLRAINDKGFLYYTEFSKYPYSDKTLPVGVFDSGTGGFTVLERILALDEFNNSTGTEGSDGIPDFKSEDFEYLADQANMPYGRYSSEGKEDYLRELAVKDALFLMNSFYWKNNSTTKAEGLKDPVKIIVIACNTATAYGLHPIEDMLSKASSSLKVIGVVNAGSRSAIDYIKNQGGTGCIGVLATPGTISSNVYERTLLAEKPEYMDLDIVSQPGYSFAEAVDEEKEIVDHSLSTFSDSYLGPKLGDGLDSIIPGLLGAYAFDFSDNKAFATFDKNGRISRIQLNSADNYARFNLVNLLEKIRIEKPNNPLKCIIMGCTHYPFYKETMEKQLNYLRNYVDSDGNKPYASLISDDCEFIDPAVNTAKECYIALRENGLLRHENREGYLQPYISQAWSGLQRDFLTEDGGLAYKFKYGREVNSDNISTVVVPFSSHSVQNATLERIKRLLPNCYRMIESFMNK